MASTTATINGRTVATGDKIIDFRGREWTFDYIDATMVYVKERPWGFVARVFPDEVTSRG